MLKKEHDITQVKSIHIKRIDNWFTPANTSKNVTIICEKESININGTSVEFPIKIDVFEDVFGKPNRNYAINRKFYRGVWDALGVFVDYDSSYEIREINFYANDKRLHKTYPKNTFNGSVLLKGENSIENIPDELKADKIVLRKLVDANGNVIALSLAENWQYRPVIPKEKYIHKPPVGNLISFHDFNFKLLVIEALIDLEVLPVFVVSEFLTWCAQQDIPVKDEKNKPTTVVVNYFKQLPITTVMADKIKELYQATTLGVYIDVFDDYDDAKQETLYRKYFTLQSGKDAKHFTSLKSIDLCLTTQTAITELKAQGIKVTVKKPDFF